MTVTDEDREAAWAVYNGAPTEEQTAELFARHRIEARRKALEDAADWLLSDGARLDYEASGKEEHAFWWACDQIRAMIEGGG